MQRTCENGHKFEKTSDCPVCPTCEKDKVRNPEFPLALSAPALRALDNAGITSLVDLSTWTRSDLGALHGMGPKGVRALDEALQEQDLQFRKI